MAESRPSSGTNPQEMQRFLVFFMSRKKNPLVLLCLEKSKPHKQLDEITVHPRNPEQLDEITLIHPVFTVHPRNPDLREA